jgi:hypothetical protein
VIPSSVKYGTNNYTVTGIGNRAFYQCTELTELTIPTSITYIGNTLDRINADVFRGCNGNVFKKVKISDLEAWCKITFADNSYANPLIVAHHLYLNESEITDLVIPNTITTLGTFQFESCHGITSLTIPSNVTDLGLATFYDCRNLTTVNIAPGLTTIGVNMFNACDNLTSINIPNTVTTIQHGAFIYSGLTSITIPNSVTSIDYQAFACCQGLTSVTIPNSVTSIGDGAFIECSSLGSIEIPNSVTSIGEGALRGCYGLKSIKVDAGNTVYDSRGGCNAIINTTSNTLIAGCSTTTIPNSVTIIGDYAFSGCSPTSIEIPNSVTSIGREAFSGCGGLTSVSIPNSVTSIGYAAFQGCSRLTSIEIPNSVTSIESSLFRYCSGLTSIEIPNSVTSIGEGAFYQCSGLTSITIPNSVNKIGYTAFYQCSKLNSVTIPNSVTSIESSLFMHCTSLTSITIPYSVKKIGENAFYGCSNLNSVSIERIKPITILSNVFTNRTNATLYVPSGNKKLYEAANYWKEFKEIVEKAEWTPRNINFADAKVKAICIQNWDINGDGELAKQEADIVTNLGEVFAGNTSITSFNELQYFTGLTSIERNIFSGCSSLNSITIPSSVNSIEYGAFAGCRSLISITVDANNSSYDSRNGCNAIIRTADNLLMAGCSKTVIENSVKAIAPLAFASYDNIVSIEIPNSVEDIAPSAFDSCTGLTNLTLPNSVKYILDRAFYNCTGLSEIHSLIESPFTIRDDVFWSWNETNGTDDKTTLYENIKLYVPYGKVDTYKATNGWKNFKNILEMADTSPINITADNMTIEYGDALPEFTFKSEGGELSGTPTITCEATSTSPVGNYPITVSKGTVENLHVTYVAGTLTITKAPLTVTANSYTIKQGNPLPTFEATYTGFKNSETSSMLTTQSTLTCSATSASAPGTYDIEVSGGTATNYSFSYTKGTLTITDADPLTVTTKSYTITYGDALPEYDYTSEGATLNGSPSISCSATTTSPVGTYPITISKGSVTNYNDTYVNGTLTITKAPLTIKAGTYTRKRGKDNPEFTLSYQGFKNNETKDVLSTQPSVTTNATENSPIGTYAVIVSGAEASNYEITHVNGTLIVERLMGDANGDGDLTEADVNAITNHIMGQTPNGFDEKAANVNGDNEVNAADIVALINLIKNLSKD